MKLPELTVRNIRATPVLVPMNYVLGTSAQAVREAPLLLVDLETEEGATGRAYQFCYLPAAAPAIALLLAEVARTVRGDRLEPIALWDKLSKRFTLIGVQGIVRMAMAMFDVACWDALAIAANTPLARFLGNLCTSDRICDDESAVPPDFGGSPEGQAPLFKSFLGAKPMFGGSQGGQAPLFKIILGAKPMTIPAYNSNGLGLMAPAAVADEAEKLLAQGFRAVKLRLGYATPEADLAAVRAVRGRVPDHVAVMADYNQALTPEEAVRRGRLLDGEGVYWIEEPVRHDDYAGCALVARSVATAVQIGENFSQVHDMERALAAGACDLVMPDLERIGGVTGWQRARDLAAAKGVSMSSHLYPEVSAHLLAVTPTAHWLEYVDWANAILAEPLAIVDGNVVVPERPGNGLVWDDAAVRKYRQS